jgi:hypothetical protein
MPAHRLERYSLQWLRDAPSVSASEVLQNRNTRPFAQVICAIGL